MEFKSCPRCQGDLHTNRDTYGSYKECMQCGWMRDIKADTEQTMFEYRKYMRVK